MSRLLVELQLATVQALSLLVVRMRVHTLHPRIAPTPNGKPTTNLSTLDMLASQASPP